jgi:hypothetical protein
MNKKWWGKEVFDWWNESVFITWEIIARRPEKKLSIFTHKAGKLFFSKNAKITFDLNNIGDELPLLNAYFIRDVMIWKKNLKQKSVYLSVITSVTQICTTFLK